MSVLELFKQTAGISSPILDPFTKHCVESIWISVSRGWFDKEKWSITATVRFMNGNTKGEQTFEAQGFDELVMKVKMFLENLP